MVNQKMSKSLKKGNQKLNELKEKYSEINFEMTMPMHFGATYDINEYVLTEESAEKGPDGASDNQSPIHISDDRMQTKVQEKSDDFRFKSTAS